MPHLPPSIHALLRQQHGVVATDQLVSSELGRRQIARLVEAGVLAPVVRGAYRTPSVPMSEPMRCAAITLAHPRVAISGPTAARLWGFRRSSSDRRVHVVAPRHWKVSDAPWCVSYRTDAIHDDDVIDRGDGIRLTSRARTALDLARHGLAGSALLSVIEQAAHDGRLTDAALRSVAVDWVNGRPWARRYLAQLDERLRGGAAESEPEVRVGSALVSAGLHGLERQHSLDLPGYGRARFDLALPELRWAVEVDVFPTHAQVAGRRRDRQRDAAASSIGWTVRRIDAEHYRRHFDDMIVWLVADARRHASASA